MLRATRRTRSSLAAALVVGIFAVTGVAISAVYPTPAYAASANFTAYTGQGNLTVLPSTSQPLFQGVADASPQGQVGQYLYAASKDPKKLAALTALYQQAQKGTATVAERAELAAAVKSSAPVASKFARVLGPAGAIYSAAEIGFVVGNKTSSAMGLDPDKNLCLPGATVGNFLAAVSGTDCTTMQELAKGVVVNGDAAAGSVGQRVCAKAAGASEACIQWLGAQDYTDQYGKSRQACEFTSNIGGSYSVRYIFGTTTDANSFGQTEGPRVDACTKAFPTATRATFFTTRFGQGITSDPTGYELQYGGSTIASGTVSQGTGDPARRQECYQILTDGKRITGEGPWKPLSKGLPTIPDLPVPDGGIVANLSCSLVSQDGSAQPFKSLDLDTSPEYQRAAAINPECGQSSVCELRLIKPGGQVCNDTDTQCPGWKQSEDLDKWKCEYGNGAIGYKPAPMTECDWYENRWEPDAQRSGNTLTRPATSSPTNIAEPVKNPAPEKTPGTDKSQANAPVADPDSTPRECFPSGWGAFNPLAWVYQPVRCAIEWAFVPRQSAIKQTGQKFTRSWESTSPFVLADTVGSWDFEPAMTGCNGIPLPANLIYDGMPSQRIASACEGTPLHPAAMAIRVFLNIFFGVGAAFMIASYMGWTIGFKGPAE